MRHTIVLIALLVFGGAALASCHKNLDPLAPCQDTVSPREKRLWCRGSTKAIVDGNPYVTKVVLTKCVMDYRDYGGALTEDQFYWFWGRQAIFELVKSLNDCAPATFKDKYTAELDDCQAVPKNPYPPSAGQVWPLAMPDEDASDVFSIVASRLFTPGQSTDVVAVTSDAGVTRHPRDEAACEACAAAMCPLSLCDGDANCVCWIGCAASGNTQDTCAKLPNTVDGVTTCGPRGTTTTAFATCLQTACAATCVDGGTTDPAACASLPMMTGGPPQPACTAFGGACGLMITGEQPPPCCDSTNGTDDACVAGACQ